jgi:putative DNA primase/helicase
MCRQAATQCNKEKMANAIASAKTVYAIERLAHSYRRLAATVDQWDADPWLLNTPDGAIDLRTGRQGRIFTKTTSRKSRPLDRAVIVRGF